MALSPDRQDPPRSHPELAAPKPVYSRPSYSIAQLHHHITGVEEPGEEGGGGQPELDDPGVIQVSQQQPSSASPRLQPNTQMTTTVGHTPAAASMVAGFGSVRSMSSTKIRAKTPPALFSLDVDRKVQSPPLSAPSPSGGRPLPTVPLSFTGAPPMVSSGHHSLPATTTTTRARSPMATASLGGTAPSTHTHHSHHAHNFPSSSDNPDNGPSTGNNGKKNDDTVRVQGQAIQGGQGGQGSQGGQHYPQPPPPPPPSAPPPPLHPSSSSTSSSGGSTHCITHINTVTSISRSGSISNAGVNIKDIKDINIPGNNANTNNANSNSLVRPLPPLPPGGARPRIRSNNTNVGASGSHSSSNVNVLSMPISWASRPVNLKKSVPSITVPGANEQEQQGQGQQHVLKATTTTLYSTSTTSNSSNTANSISSKTYSRPPSRPASRSRPPSRPSSRPPSRTASRPSSPPLSPSPPPRPPSNRGFGSRPSSPQRTRVGQGKDSAGLGLPQAGKLRSRSASRSRAQPPVPIPVNTRSAGDVMRYESFAGAIGPVAPSSSGTGSSDAGASSSASTTTSTAATISNPTPTPNTAPPTRPQGSRTIPPSRKRRATAPLASPLDIPVITKSQPVGLGLGITTTSPAGSPLPQPQPAPQQSQKKRLAISPPPASPPLSHRAPPQGLVAGLGGPTTPSHTPLPTPTLHTHNARDTRDLRETTITGRRNGGVQLSRDLVSRAAAVPAPLNPNYNYYGVARGVVYVSDKEPFQRKDDRKEDKGKGKEKDTDQGSSPNKPAFPIRTTSLLTPDTSPIPVAHTRSDDEIHSHPLISPLSPSSPPSGTGIVEQGGADDDAISCLSYIDDPPLEPVVGVHPDFGALSFASGEEIILGEQEEPLLVYIDDNFDSSGEGEEFTRSVSPMRYARPGSDGSISTGDEDGSDESSDFFSDVDDPFKYNKRRSRRRGRTRTRNPVGLLDDSASGARGNKGESEGKGKTGVRMAGSLGSMRDLIEARGWSAKEKNKEEGARPKRTKSAERDGPTQRYQQQQQQQKPHPQHPPPLPPPRSLWFAAPEFGSKSNQSSSGGGTYLTSPVSPQGRSLSPMRYAKRMSVELTDDSSSMGSPISPVGSTPLLGGGRYRSVGVPGIPAIPELPGTPGVVPPRTSTSKKPKKKRNQPWSTYQFDYQAAKASSPFTFGMGGERVATAAEEKEKAKAREKEEEKRREKEKEKMKTKVKRDGRLSEPAKRRLSIDVLDISILRSRAPHLPEPSVDSAGHDDVFGLGEGGGGSGSGSGFGSGSGRTTRYWDESPASSTASTFTVTSAQTPGKSAGDGSGSTPLTSAPSSTSQATVARSRTFKVRNP